jgi:hypothetical protein
VNKSAFPFLPIPADSNRNKSIISYDISESEASKSKTIDSLLPKKIVPKLELTAPIGPEPIKDFVPNITKKAKEKKKEKNEVAKKELTKTEVKAPAKADSISYAQASTLRPDSLKTDTVSTVKITKPIIAYKAKPKPLKNYGKSLFEYNLLQTHNLNPKIRNNQGSDWVTIVLLVVVGIICILNISYRSRLKKLFNAFTSNRFVGQIVREENVMFQRISIFLSLLFLVVTSLFIFQFGRFFKMPFSSNNSFTNYSVILIFLFVFYFIKISTFNFLGFLLKIEKEMKEYVFTIFLYNHFIGLALIPLVVLVAFVPGIMHKWVFIGGALFFVIGFIARTYRSYGNVSAGAHFSIFYLFLYLCALEILPLVVITKLISNIV